MYNMQYRVCSIVLGFWRTFNKTPPPPGLEGREATVTGAGEGGSSHIFLAGIFSRAGIPRFFKLHILQLKGGRIFLALKTLIRSS